MSILGGFRADQLIGQLVSETDINSAKAHKLIDRLKKIGPKVIPKALDALAMSDKNHTVVFVDILASQVSDKTLPRYKEGLADGGERVIAGTAWALSSSHNYDPNNLLDFLDDKEVSKPALIEILKVHKVITQRTIPSTRTEPRRCKKSKKATTRRQRWLMKWP